MLLAQDIDAIIFSCPHPAETIVLFCYVFPSMLGISMCRYHRLISGITYIIKNALFYKDVPHCIYKFLIL